MNKTRLAVAILITLEMIVLTSACWLLLRNLARNSGFERTVVAWVFCSSTVALFVSSLVLRTVAPVLVRLAWVTLFAILVVGILFPRL